MAKHFLKGIWQNTNKKLTAHGLFREKVEIDLNQNYMPFIMDKVIGKIIKKKKSKDISKVFAKGVR